MSKMNRFLVFSVIDGIGCVSPLRDVYSEAGQWKRGHLIPYLTSINNIDCFIPFGVWGD